ncbi:MAG: hypothetical protein L3J20_08630 [Flavobacteriaceae bacterium]|nr:hypothetical protein [Flavobacteriaceae bacterium]
MYLKECITLLEKEFPDKWSSNFIENDTINEHKEEELLIKLTAPLESIFINLNLSVISGEYIAKEDISKIFDTIKSKLKSIYLDSSKVDDKKINEWNNKIQFEFIKPIKEGIDSYYLLVKKITNSLKFIKTRSFIMDKEGLDTNKQSKAEEKLQILFGLNLILSFIDLNLSLSRSDLDDLIRIKYILTNELNELELSKILLEKTEFLINKINYRFDQNEANYQYEINFKTIDLRDNFEIFKDYNNGINYHYKEHNRNSNHFKSVVNSIYKKKEKNNSSIDSLKEFHTLIKYYKDDEQNAIRIFHLIKDFKKFYKEKTKSFTSDSIYDAFQSKAINISYNYMLNNGLSLLIKKDSKKFENKKKIKDFFEKIKRLQDNTHIKNYFPYLKYTEYLLYSNHLAFRESKIPSPKLSY